MKMQQLKHIKRLVVETAKYNLNDGNGNKILLIVDYKNNKYKASDLKHIANTRFCVEVQKLAKGLLARKHKVNLAEKDQYL